MSDPLPRLTAALADRYRIERELGAGGMATVYLAEDLKHHREVAVKVLQPELSALLGAERFLREIETTAALQHPHILPLFDSGTADGSSSTSCRSSTARRCATGSIARSSSASTKRCGSRGTWPTRWICPRHGVIHRDIKPENILLHGGHAMVADFGIALALERGGGRADDRDRPVARHAALHESGAGDGGEGDHCAVRHLLARSACSMKC